jgi:ABC-type proline/glycine betaine transport system permease subunit
MNILHDQRGSLISDHAGMVAVAVLLAVAVGVLVGYGAADLYETADHWVLRA